CDANPKVVEALANDLNTSLAITELVEQAKYVLPSAHPNAHGHHQQLAAQLKRTAALLGLLTKTESEWHSSKPIQFDLLNQANRLSRLRSEAIHSKDYSSVDAYKSALTAAGVEVRMSKDGVELLPGPGFDPAKLAEL
ncbi:MAG: hypothetical protein JNJ84_08720, partial [Rhodobacteraceae bacterium]|nr:hypothetical protein [Paracoccaceae bacterium]